MAIEFETRRAEEALKSFIAMTPETSHIPTVPSAWYVQSSDKGTAYKNIDSDNIGLYDIISKIIEACACDPEALIKLGEILDNTGNSQVFRVENLVVKKFKFMPWEEGWERERRAGVSAARFSVMLETGLAHYRETYKVPIFTPRLHACFYPSEVGYAPIWIMEYVPTSPDETVANWELLDELGIILKDAIETVGGERFLETLQFGNTTDNWQVHKKDDVYTKLVKFGGSIRSDRMSQTVWEGQESLFRI